jgi:protein TonB
MLISKFNLYKTEWLDLVFDDRNKEYGAYYLRQHYASNMVRAMLITFSGLVLIFGSTFLYGNHHVIIDQLPKNDTTVVNLTEIKLPELKHPKPSKPIEPPKASEPVKTIENPPPVVTPDNQAKKPVTTADLQTAISGQQTLNSKEGGGIVDVPDNTPGDGTPVVDNTVYAPGNLDFMPEPVGGASAWAKFLNKNLRFPIAAQEDGISGKVFLSFIIEKDGHLSNIVVDKGAGHGFDEEALRVLKLAKAWKPGMQNGQPVRVKYSIPINFQLSE